MLKPEVSPQDTHPLEDAVDTNTVQPVDGHSETPPDDFSINEALLLVQSMNRRYAAINPRQKINPHRIPVPRAITYPARNQLKPNHNPRERDTKP